MINFVERVAIFYASGAIIIGLVFATFPTVSFTKAGKPVRFPRLFSAMLCGAIWPMVLWQIIFQNGENG